MDEFLILTTVNIRLHTYMVHTWHKTFLTFPHFSSLIHSLSILCLPHQCLPTSSVILHLGLLLIGPCLCKGQGTAAISQRVTQPRSRGMLIVCNLTQCLSSATQTGQSNHPETNTMNVSITHIEISVSL